MLSRLRASRPIGDDGITLMELIVAMVISVIIGTMAVMFFVNILHSSDKTVLTNQDTGDARVALDSWTSMLRVADFLDTTTKVDRFEEITPKKVVFYAGLNNRTTADGVVGSLTKVALMFNETNATTHDGELVEVVFVAGSNSTVQQVRRVALNVSQTNGLPIFQPVTAAGGNIDVAQFGCRSGGNPKAGLCLQPGTPGAGTVDPTVANGTSTVTAGTYSGNSATVDKTLRSVGGIQVQFTVRDPSHTASMDFTSTAMVSSGFPS